MRNVNFTANNLNALYLYETEVNSDSLLLGNGNRMGGAYKGLVALVLSHSSR